MKIEELLPQYNEQLSHFKHLKTAGIAALKRELQKRSLKVESVSGRIKAFDKLQTKASAKNMSNPFTEMSDIVGLRVICLFQSDIDTVKDIIRQTFDVVKEDDKLSDREKDVFNYGGTHFDVRLRDISDDETTSGVNSTSSDLHGMVFEIQIKTICQHAWSVISHNLFYKPKNDNDIAHANERDFYAINGLFYVADTHFEMIKLQNASNAQG